MVVEDKLPILLSVNECLYSNNKDIDGCEKLLFDDLLIGYVLSGLTHKITSKLIEKYLCLKNVYVPKDLKLKVEYIPKNLKFIVMESFYGEYIITENDLKFKL